MDGIHDLGGMEGFGPVIVEPDEPVFHADWERRVCRLTMGAQARRLVSGRFRYAIERMDPAWYLEALYYERWLTATATVLVETGIVSRSELDEALGGDFDVSRPLRTGRITDPGESSRSHRFAVGDRVCVRRSHPTGHTRSPRYVRGRTGIVDRLGPPVPIPDITCHCDNERVEPTYSVRFEARELWSEAGDPVYVDLWESYLEPAPGKGLSDGGHERDHD